jgi:hypothetical protein
MMRTPIRVEVEPLSQRRWAKVEDSLFSRLEQESQVPRHGLPDNRIRPRSWIWSAAAAMLVGMIAVLVGRSFFEAEERPGVEQASRITTGARASHLELPGLRLDVEAESTVVIGGETGTGRLIVVDRGSILCNVAPRSARTPLVVQAGAAQVRVVGTRFRVTRVGEAARVEVTEGAVEVTAAGQTSRVAAGQVWPTKKAPSAGAPPRVLDPGDAEHVDSTGQPEPSSRPDSPATQPMRKAKQKDSRQARFEQATLLERTDPSRAIALYRSIEGGADSWAKHALYAHGRLEAARGNSEEARRLLRQYLARFPKGANSADARAVLDRLR